MAVDPKALFEQGVVAIREEKDLGKGRDLLLRSLRADPRNEQAWLWLSRTTSDTAKRMQCLEKALSLNPDNLQTRQAIDKLKATLNPAPAVMSAAVAIPAAAVEAAPRSEPEMPAETALPQPEAAPKRRKADPGRIDQLMSRAQAYLDKEDIDNALEHWLRVLEIQSDHEMALRYAVKYLTKQKMSEDAFDLLKHAIDEGTQNPAIFLTAIELGRRLQQDAAVDVLREKLAALPTADEAVVAQTIDSYIERDLFTQALDLLQKAVEAHPKSQKLAIRLARLYDQMERRPEATEWYERVVRLGARTPEGKQADKRLSEFTPQVTDQERGSVVLALREALGIGAFILVLAWLDAGLNFANMGPARWLGVLAGLVGAYLLVTATSSPQQKPLAGWLGGQVPPEPEPFKDEFNNLVTPESSKIPILGTAARAGLGLVAVILLGASLWLVFRHTVEVATNPNPTPFYVPTFNEMFGIE
ncbi:MAG: tetratricopeptide repeat protein [Anaerolineae bacterium]|nr:tetratricopeptide repeat protein [Anaerolineae bacterium]